MRTTTLNVLIVHAHHEPKSFGSALFHVAVQTLSDAGHSVVTSDLYTQRFDPVSDRRNFTTTFDADYLKQGNEERHATAVNGFAPDLECEIRKLETCDLLIVSFPLWSVAMPAILKGWVDRTFAYSRIFGGTRMYENVSVVRCQLCSVGPRCQGSRQKVADRRRNFCSVGFEREVACIVETYFSRRVVTLERFGSIRKKEGIVLAPDG